MFVIKSLGKLIWGNPDIPELIKISAGQLYLVRPNSLKGTRECIFHDAQAVVRRTAVEWQYQLVVTRVYQEGEDELINDSLDIEDDEKPFLIDGTLNFRKGHIDGLSTFSWRDLSGDPDDVFEFVCDVSTTAHTVNAFEITIYQCMYERKYKKSNENATEEELQMSLSSAKQSLIFDFPGAPPEVEIYSTANGELHYYDPGAGVFILGKPGITATILRGERFEYFLIIVDDVQRLIVQKLEPRMNIVFNQEGHVYSLLMKFNEQESEARFKKKLSTAMYETLNETRVKEDDQDYIMSAYQEDTEMVDSESINEESGNGKHCNGESPNTQLAVGYKHDRSFVLKGNNIGVYKHTDDDNLEFSTNIAKIKKPSGLQFNPSKAMLHEEDSSMILMDPNDEHNLYKMDLEYGKVVEEWKVHEDVPCENIFPDKKYAQMTGEKTFIGMSHNSLFRVDPRLPNEKLVDSQLKLYTTKNAFSCGTTDSKGHIAVGSSKGDVKLFDTLGKNAKTNLPALGSAIKGIDVSSDGKWVIATTSRYLLLIDTELPSDPNHRLGFEKSFPKDKKPTPRILQLRPEHVSLMEHEVDFTPARFNTGESDLEKAIVTSTGPFVITWNFRRVKQGKLDDYQIKRYTDNVVADNFRYGQDPPPTFVKSIKNE
ncbi:20172_t:CDS:10 [Entrophospora sp. SA101]|nr:20172_t:CDS:10 [Entrophospora sp. SA101]